MIPETTSINVTEGITLPSLTYELNINTNRASSKIDNLKAVEQAIWKILVTPRYAHEIYDANYGHEINTLIGQSYSFVISELPRMVREALLTDDRIIEVIDFEYNKVSMDSMECTFTVNTIYGNIRYTQEVSIRG